jgi:hypothetical protein
MVGGLSSARSVVWALALTVLVAGSPASSVSAEDLGPPIGTKAPDIGTRLDQTGQPRALSDLWGEKRSGPHVLSLS